MNNSEIKSNHFVKPQMVIPGGCEISSDDFETLLRVSKHLTEVVDLLSSTSKGLQVSADKIYEITASGFYNNKNESSLMLQSKLFQLFVADSIVEFCLHVETAINFSIEIKKITFRLIERYKNIGCNECFEEMFDDLNNARILMNNLHVYGNLLVVVSHFLHNALGFVNSVVYGCFNPSFNSGDLLKKLVVSILDDVAENVVKELEVQIAKRCFLEYSVISNETMASLSSGNDSIVALFMAQKRALSIDFIENILALIPELNCKRCDGMSSL